MVECVRSVRAAPVAGGRSLFAGRF